MYRDHRQHQASHIHSASSAGNRSRRSCAAGVGTFPQIVMTMYVGCPGIKGPFPPPVSMSGRKSTERGY